MDTSFLERDRHFNPREAKTPRSPFRGDRYNPPPGKCTSLSITGQTTPSVIRRTQIVCVSRPDLHISKDLFYVFEWVSSLFI
jgi:hypothetical protein